MPWQECRKVDERMRFVARLLDGEKMAVLCREFDVSRKTGYKIFSRYKDCGLHGLTDRSGRPYRHANRLPFQIESLIVQLKREHPSCGAPQDPREDQASQLGCCAAGHQHRACGARSPWSRHPRSPSATVHAAHFRRSSIAHHGRSSTAGDFRGIFRGILGSDLLLITA